jgi:hypothetical protein
MTLRQTRLSGCRRAIPEGMIKGLYRTRDRLLGAAVRVHWSAGDAAPVVSESVYAAMGGVPELSALPSRADYCGTHQLQQDDPLELA